MYCSAFSAMAQSGTTTIKKINVNALRTRVSAISYLRVYGIPLLLAFLLIGGAYWRSFDQGQHAWTELKVKHDLNTCQVYAYNLQQRHPAGSTPRCGAGPIGPASTNKRHPGSSGFLPR